MINIDGVFIVKKIVSKIFQPLLYIVTGMKLTPKGVNFMKIVSIQNFPTPPLYCFGKGNKSKLIFEFKNITYYLNSCSAF